MVTLVLSVQHALDVADRWPRTAQSVEVIDLRTLVPLDRDAVLEVGRQDRTPVRG